MTKEFVVKKFIMIILILSLLTIILPSCGYSDNPSDTGYEQTISSIPTAKPTATMEATVTPEPSGSLVDEYLEVVYGDYDIIQRIETINMLVNLDSSAGAAAAYELLFNINSEKTIFFEYLEIIRDYAPIELKKLAFLLVDEGYGNITAFMAEALSNSKQSWEDNNNLSNLLYLMRDEWWFEKLVPPLIEGGWFDILDSSSSKPMHTLDNLVGTYVKKYDAEKMLASVYFVNEIITPLVSMKYSTFDNFGWCNAASHIIAFENPDFHFGTETSSESLESAKFLFIDKRTNPVSEEETVMLNTSWQIGLPLQYSPKSMQEVNYLVVVDTAYIYHNTYSNGITKGYSSKSHVSIFSYPTGELVRVSPATILGYPPSSLTYYGSPPECELPAPSIKKIFDILDGFVF